MRSIYEMTNTVSGLLNKFNIIHTVDSSITYCGLVVRYLYNGMTFLKYIPYDRLKNGLYMYDIMCIVNSCSKGDLLSDIKARSTTVKGLGFSNVYW